jgi:hypothetical protein
MSGRALPKYGLVAIAVALAFVGGVLVGSEVSSSSNPVEATPLASPATTSEKTPTTTTAAPITIDSTSPTTTVPVDPPTILVVGDSNGLLLAEGMKIWAAETGLAVVENRSIAGCGMGRGGDRKDWDFPPQTIPEFCNGWETRWAEHIDEFEPDIVLIVSAAWEVTTRRLADDPEWRAMGDPIYDDFLRSEFSTALDVLGAGGATIVWPKYMYLEVGRAQGVDPEEPYPASDHDRMDRVNAIIREFVDDRDEVIAFDLANLLEEAFAYGQLDPVMRPDGVHFTEGGAIAAGAEMGNTTLEVVAEHLGAS